MMNIIEAINNENLFRPFFKDLKTWSAWIVALKAIFGLKMSKDELTIFQRCTGRSKPPKKEIDEFWCICGRRGGKSKMASIIAVYLALFHSYKEFLTPGEVGTIQVLATNRYQARVILSYIRGIFENNPVFDQYVERGNTEQIVLTNGIAIEVSPASHRSIRGRTCVAILMDEVAFWRIEGVSPDTEILAAARPAMASIPTSKLIVISSPYSRSGILYEHYRDYFGKDTDPGLLVWKAATRTMNPCISEALIERETIKDASAARAEWFAEFREDLEDFLNLDAVTACVAHPGELAPQKGNIYHAFVDPSGGRIDRFTVAIGHQDFQTMKLSVDLLRGWTPPINPDDVVFEITERLKQYRVSRVVGDRYAGAWVSSAFDKHGITYEPAARPKSELYLGFEGYINTQRVQIPKHTQLINELVNLERRRSRSGKDTVDHPPRGKDDFANAVAGLCSVLTGIEHGFFRDCDLN
jgi:hypothetical protein